MQPYDITLWCNRIIKLGYYLLFTLVPLLLTPINYELFEYNKMMAVYAITVIVGLAWAIKSLTNREVRLRRTPLDIPLGLFVLSQLISSIFSLDRHVSWLGYYSRFNGGMWSVISYAVLFEVLVANIEIFGGTASTVKAIGKAKSGTKSAELAAPAAFIFRSLINGALATGAIVAIYGVLEHFGIDKSIWVQDVQNRVFSTLGQPNWLAAYLVALIPAAMSCAVEAMRNIQLPLKRLHLHDFVSMVYYWGLTVLFFVVLLYTRSRSGLLGFAVADVLFWLLLLTQARTSSSQPGEPVRLSVKAGFAIHIVLAAVLLINGTGTPALDRYLTVNGLKNLVTKSSSPRQNNTPQTAANPSYVAPALESGGTESGVIRKYVWQGAITAWKSSTKALLIGTGTESFAFAFYRYRPVAHNLTSEWDFLYNKAHNEYLNYLATTGIFGLGSYLVFLLVAMWWMLFGRNKRKTPIAPQHSLMQMALFAGWVSILVTNFFGFSVVIVQVFLFLLPCMVMAMAIAADEDAIHTVQISVPKWVTWATMVIGIYLLFTIGKFWYADTLYAQGYRLNRASAVAQATPLLITAVSLNPSEPMYHDELSNSYASLAVGEAQSQNATQAASLAKLAVDENDKTLAISPNNVNYWKSRTKIFYTLSALDPALNQQAIDALNSALALSPNDPKIYYNLAVLVGRQGNGDAAVSDLMKAKELKPNYRDAYYALSIFYGEQNKKTEARAILQSYLDTIDPTDKQFHDILAK